MGTLKNNRFALNKSRVTISADRDKQFEEANSMKVHLEELQEKLDDKTNTQSTAERAAIDKLLSTEKSQQTAKISCQLSTRNVELEREIKEIESILTALENSEGNIILWGNLDLLIERKKSPCNSVQLVILKDNQTRPKETPKCFLPVKKTNKNREITIHIAKHHETCLEYNNCRVGNEKRQSSFVF